MSTWTVTEPCVVDGMPDDVYRADPVPSGSLSASGAKVLLRAPALFRHQREHGRPNQRHYDVGHGAHKLVLGAGPELVRIDAEEWRSKAVKEEVAAAYDVGKVPLRPSDYEAVHEMAAALRRHPIAGKLFDPDRGGKPEQSMFWGGGDVWLRARLDWLPDPNGAGRMIVPDYKTADNADPRAFGRVAASYSYHLQDAWYTAAVDNLLGRQAAFLFVIQEKAPPYLVTVVELDAEAKRAGHREMRRAIEMYRDCAAADVWPGYTAADEIRLVSLPAYATRDTEEPW